MNNTTFEKYYSNELKKAFEYMVEMTKQAPVSEVGARYFLVSCLENKDTMMYRALNGFMSSMAIENVRNEFLCSQECGVISISGIPQTTKYSEDFRELISLAHDEMEFNNHSLMTTDHFLLAVLKDKNGFKTERSVFMKNGIDYKRFKELSDKLHQFTETISNVPSNVNVNDIMRKSISENSDAIKKLVIIGSISNDGKNNFSSKGQRQVPKKNEIEYCTNLNAVAAEGNLDPIIGRNDEILKIVNVFSRRNCNNVVLVGKAGVGKTAIVNGIVRQIADGVSHLSLYDKTIYRLNPIEMMSGTQFRGMFEGKMNALINNLRSHKGSILFIDDFHTLCGENQKNEFNMTGMMHDLLTDGSVKVIITTTYAGYKTIFGGNKELARRFQRIDVSEPSDSEVFDIVSRVAKDTYQEYHGVTYTDKALEECVRLSKRYVSDRSLPTSAIDIIDEVGAYVSLRGIRSDEHVKLSLEYNRLESEKVQAIAKDDMELASELNEKMDSVMKDIVTIENSYKSKKSKKTCATVTENDIYEAISRHTNVDIKRIGSDDKESVMNLFDNLHSKIIGQDEALRTVTNAIKRNKVGLSRNNKPIYSCICIGSTGVGKTLLAKSLAKELFGSEESMVRFDMSEYSDKTAANKLIGSSAGYIGYENGGLITEAIKNKKNCVLLIDEIEKATDEVFNLFLQVLDEGFLTDNMGEKVDFRNTIIIMTSNVGAKKASQTNSFGFDSNDYDARHNVISKELKNKFPPEFINRIDDVMYFNPLDDTVLKKIVALEIGKLNDRLNLIGHSIKYTDDVLDYIIKSIGNDREYGARPIIRAVQTELENKITDFIIENSYKSHVFNARILDDKLFVE